MRLPDGPQTPPFLQLLHWVSRPLDFLESCAQRYGDPFTVQLSGPEPIVFFSDPGAIREIFTADAVQFEAGQSNSLLLPLLGDNSLLILDGDRHQRQRRLLMPPFHGDRMRTYSQLICQVTEQVISQWQVSKPFAVRSSMQEITLRVILQAVFGLSEGARYSQIRQLLATMLDSIASPLSSSLLFFPALQRDFGAWSPWGRFLRLRQQVDQLLYAEIRERRNQLDRSRTDILSLLMSARDEAGQPMSEVELRDELITLLVAGHETTASALTWALYWVQQSGVQEKLRSELDRLNYDPASPASLAPAVQLPYLSAVCQETLRIYPVAMLAIPRIVKSSVQLMGYEFGAGTALAPCIYLTHHREDLYPNPNQFRPERFLERQFSAYEYLPFGGGDRRCIGLALAQLEMKLVLATILSRYELGLVDRPVRPVRRGVTLAPASGRWLVATRQRHPQLDKVPA